MLMHMLVELKGKKGSQVIPHYMAKSIKPNNHKQDGFFKNTELLLELVNLFQYEPLQNSRMLLVKPLHEIKWGGLMVRP